MIKGKKIFLMGIYSKHLQDVLELREDFEINRSLQRYPYPINDTSEEEWIKNLYGRRNSQRIDFGIFDLDKNFIGLISAKNIDYINRRAEYGIIIKRTFQGKGLAKEATILFLNYLFNEVNLERIYLEVLEDNLKAINLYESIGFKKEGILRLHSYQEGKRKNVFYMGLLKDEFLKL